MGVFDINSFFDHGSLEQQGMKLTDERTGNVPPAISITEIKRQSTLGRDASPYSCFS